MIEIALWILIAAGNNGARNPEVIDRFASKQECLNTAAAIKHISNETLSVPYMAAFCVPAKVVREK